MSKELEEYKYGNLELLREIWVNVPEGSQKMHQKHFDLILSKLNELQAIKETNPSEALECLDKLAKQIELDEDTDYWEIRNAHRTVEQALIKAQADEKLKVDICEMFGLDNLFPYNDTKAILKELEEYMDKNNQLWVDFMKTSKELKELKKKNYLKWEDLEFKEKGQGMKVLLNGKEYTLFYGLDVDTTWVELVAIANYRIVFALNDEEKHHKQFFNDLHLEVLGDE